ncbi:MAG: alpha/beta fold hydrolase [Propionibacteriales bacterium]|nr:alpha/beta fold hydrolase [Propionibacteriales bacterium]
MSSIFDPRRTLEQRRQAVANLYDFLVKGGIADTTRMPSDVIDDGHKATLHRYHPTTEATALPVLMVPPLGSQATCFDLRRGCSMTEHFVDGGRPTYLVDYGAMTFEDKDLGLEFFVNDVVAPAVRKVSADNGGQPVNLVGWCMGGLIALMATAAHADLPINAVAMVASPFDLSKNPMLAPVRLIGKYTDGTLVGGAFKAMGGVPARIVGPAFKLTAIATYAKKPLTLFKYRDDREFLAHIEAVDGLMNNMLAYPGRATLQAYQRLALKNELATGTIQGPNKVVHLADITVPVMNVAGGSDVLVPVAVAHQVGELLPNSPDVRLETAPGGHLGVLAGSSARTTTWALIDDFLDSHAG